MKKMIHKRPVILVSFFVNSEAHATPAEKQDGRSHLEGEQDGEEGWRRLVDAVVDLWPRGVAGRPPVHRVVIVRRDLRDARFDLYLGHHRRRRTSETDTAQTHTSGRLATARRKIMCVTYN